MHYRTDRHKIDRSNSGPPFLDPLGIILSAIIRRKERPRTSGTHHNETPVTAPFGPSHLATELELSDFLKSVERRAFKRSVYHVRNEESALDIVQDSMMKLAEHYGDKPPAELPMLFQRILSNCTLDWFRRQKTRNALFSNMGEFESAADDGDFELLDVLDISDNTQQEIGRASCRERV